MSCENKTCPSIPDPPPDKPFLYVKDMLNEIKADLPCYTDHSYTEVEKSSYGIKTTSIEDVKNDVLNCEEIQAIAKSYKNVQNNISCLINQTCNKQTISLASLQNMNIDCPEVKVDTISQRSDSTIISSLDLTENEIQRIGNEVKNITEQMAEVIKTSTKNRPREQEKGARTASIIDEKLNNLDYSSAIKKSIIEFNNSMLLKQNMNIESNVLCQFISLRQEVQATIIARSLINGTLNSVFGDILKDKATEDTKTIKESENKIAEKKSSDDKKTIIYVSIGIFIFIIMIVIIVLLV